MRNISHNIRMEEMPEGPEVAQGAIEFAPWPTAVENDELWLVTLRYGDASQKVDFVSDGFSLQLAEGAAPERGVLEATFFSREKRAAIVFTFTHVSAFRVLDEHGLTDMWLASSKEERPAHTTFKVKGHKWQEESFLTWFMSSCEFSFMIATGWDCLEVVSASEPTIELRCAIVTEYPTQIKH